MGARVFRSTEGYDPVDLLKFGRGHLHAAELLFTEDHHCLDSAAHLGHLAIELLIKAALLHKRGFFPGQHNLPKLLAEASLAGISLHLDDRAAELLKVIAPFEECRYPRPQQPIEIATEDLRKLQELWNSLLAQLPDDLRNAFLTADQTTKGGRALFVEEPDNNAGA